MSVRIVVLGGGYAGVMAANRLAGRRDATPLEVTLVTARDRFVQRIRLHEYVAGSASTATLPFDSVLHADVRLSIASASRIDIRGREVVLDDGRRVPYDYLVYAVGSGGTAEPAGTHAAGDLESAVRLRAEIETLRAAAAVAIVGGGLTAVETAAEIAEQHPRLTVRMHTGGTLAAGHHPRQRERIRSSLRRLGVEMAEGAPVSRTGDLRAALGAELVVWCAGVAVPPLAAESGLHVDVDGRLRVDAALAADVERRIFGAGDAAVIDDPAFAYHRMSCAAAMPMGAHAADNVLALLDGREPHPISTGFLAQCVSLGRKDGLIQFVERDDTPRAFGLAGRLGALAKETINRQTLRWLRGEAHRAGSYSWPHGPQQPVRRNDEEMVWS